MAFSFGVLVPLPHHTSNPATYRGFLSLGRLFVYRMSTNWATPSIIRSGS